MSAPVVGVLALQGDVREHLAMLERTGATGVAVRRPAELERLDGLVMPGGESTTIEKLARAFDLFEPLRSELRSGLPAFGTCAGMIMLADRIEDDAVSRAVAEYWSWSRIAEALGVTKQAVHRKHAKRVKES